MIAEVHTVLAAMRALQRTLDNPLGHWDWQETQLHNLEDSL